MPEPTDPTPERYVIEHGWICLDTGQHNCVGGTIESSGIHEPGCGLEPVATVEDAQEALAEVHRLHSWAGLMELLDEHWPADIFEMGDTPGAAKESTADPGVRIVALIRWVDRLTAARTAALEWATTILRSPGDMPVADVAWQVRRIFNAQPAEQEDAVPPPGQYAQGARSPIVWAFLCPTCAGYAPITAKDYNGALSAHCQGCGSWRREVHRLAAYIDSRSGCGCRMEHRRVVGDLSAESGHAEGGAQ